MKKVFLARSPHNEELTYIMPVENDAMGEREVDEALFGSYAINLDEARERSVMMTLEMCEAELSRGGLRPPLDERKGALS